jgi:cell wall-associated NlpC family hydrolase
MMKTALFLALTLAFQVGVSDLSQAVQRKHRPWLMIGSHEAVEDTGVIASSPRATPTVAKANDKDPGVRVAHRALDYRGTRYRYGGTTKRGLDCSGLVNRVWEDLKMQKIPRASNALYNSGKPVHLAELRAGDLVFFKNTSKRGISHVGVYTGNNKFVHAAGHAKGVTITKLSDPYYQLHYAGARRLY